MNQTSSATGRIAARTVAAAMALAAYGVVCAGNAFAGDPYGGTPHPIPGIIQTENYDLGGEGVGYHDISPGNAGGFYRDDDVDIKQSTDVGGGYAIGWFNAGEWLEYTVNVAQSGLYDMQLRVGSMFPGRTMSVAFNGTNVTGDVAVPQMPDWDMYQTVTISNVVLTAGQQQMRVTVGVLDYLDLNWIRFIRHRDGTLLRIIGHVSVNPREQRRNRSMLRGRLTAEIRLFCGALHNIGNVLLFGTSYARAAS